MTRRRLPGRCLYCGAHLRAGGTLACTSHGDLPAIDPTWRQETRRPLQQAPDLPILILTRKAA